MTGEGAEKNAKNDIDDTLAKLMFSGTGNDNTMKESHNTFQRSEVIYSPIFCINHCTLKVLIFRLDDSI